MSPFCSQIDLNWNLGNEPERRPFQGLPRLAGSITIAIGVLVLAGWTFQIELLMQLSPGFATMNPLTASCFILAGTSLLLISGPQTASVFARRASLVFACVLMAAGLLKIFDYLGVLSFSLDQSLLPNLLTQHSGVLRTRMVPNTALCFLLCGLSLGLLHSPSSKAAVVAQWLTLSVIAQSLLALMGYLYDATFLYAIGPDLPMAAYTAAAFLLLGYGLLLLRPDFGPVALFVSKTQGGATARRLLPFAFAIPATLGTLRLQAERSRLLEPELASTILVVLSFAAFTVLIWWHAHVLDQIDLRRQKAENDLKRSHDQLEIRVQERTADLLRANEALRSEIAQRDKAEAQIRQQADEKRKLEEQILRSQRMESMGALAGGIAHDLNNALAPIIIGSEMLGQEHTTHAERENVLKAIKASGHRCSQMVKQILAFARGTPPETGSVDLPRVLKEMATLAKDTFPKSITVHCHVAKDLWNLQGDSTELHQLLLNLCVNARDAMPKGGALTLSAENFTALNDPETARPAGPYILLTVADTGPGIPPDILEHIFDPFFTTKDKGTGTGLGLSIVATIVKRHHGFISVQTALAQGTEMKVYLPATIP